jgi:hypothetical protein
MRFIYVFTSFLLPSSHLWALYESGSSPEVPTPDGIEEWRSIIIAGELYGWIEAVQMSEGDVCFDAAVCALLDAYDGLYASGLLEQVKRVAGVAPADLLVEGPEQDVVRRALGTLGAKGSRDLFAFVQRAVIAYSHNVLQERGLGEAGEGKPEEEKRSPRVIVDVRVQTWVQCMQIKATRALGSDDALLAFLLRTYALFVEEDAYDLMNEVGTLAGLALSCFGLGASERALIQEARDYEAEKGEGEENLFAYVQRGMLLYVEAVVDDAGPRDPREKTREGEMG